MSQHRLRRTAASLALAAAGLTGGAFTPGWFGAHAASAVSYTTGSAWDPAIPHAAAALDALQRGDTAAYRSELAALADEIAPRAAVDAPRLLVTWESASTRGMTVMLSALTQLGVSYHYATSTPGVSFDCSGLVKWAWSQVGVDLPSNSGAIIRSFPTIPMDQVQPGDVLGYPGHVMIALGVDDAVVHAVGRGRPLEVHAMYGRIRGVRAVDPGA